MQTSQNYKLLSLLIGVLVVVLFIFIWLNVDSLVEKKDVSTMNIQLGYESLQFDIPSGWHINTNPNWVSNTTDTLTIIGNEEVKQIPNFTRFPVTITTKTKSEMLGEGDFETYYENNYPRQFFQNTELIQLSDNSYRINGMRIDQDAESEGTDLFIIGNSNVFWIMLDNESFTDNSQSEFIDSLEYTFDDSF